MESCIRWGSKRHSRAAVAEGANMSLVAPSNLAWHLQLIGHFLKRIGILSCNNHGLGALSGRLFLHVIQSSLSTGDGFARGIKCPSVNVQREVNRSKL
jgi:hypothetical protein